MNITPEFLRRIAPVPSKKVAAQRRITDAIAPLLNDLLPKARIAGPWRITHFLAQAAHETDGFSTLEEYASGKAYEGRTDLGNTQPGDGQRFKGRGIFQTTGRHNYLTTGKRLGVDLIAAPEKLLEPEWAVKSAIDYWNSRQLSGLADANDIVTLTKRINGGTNGMQDRRGYAARIEKALFDGPLRSLKRGNRGPAVVALQEALNAVHYFVGDVDGVFGPRTDDAVRGFQRDHRLKIDGIAGAGTWAALGQAVAKGATRPVLFARAHTDLSELAANGSRIAASSIQGTWASLGAVATALPLILTEASGLYRTHLQPLRELLEPFGGPDRVALTALLAVSLFSAFQHVRAGRARTEDHRTGKTL